MNKNKMHTVQEKNKCIADGRSSVTRPSDLNIQPTLTPQACLEQAAAVPK